MRAQKRKSFLDVHVIIRCHRLKKRGKPPASMKKCFIRKHLQPKLW